MRDGKSHAVSPNVIGAVNQVEVVSVGFADFRLERRQKIGRVKIWRGCESGRVSKFFVNFGAVVIALGKNFAHDFLEQN